MSAPAPQPGANIKIDQDVYLLRRGFAVQHVIANAQGDGHDLVNQFLLYVEIFERRFQMVSDDLEVGFIEAGNVRMCLAEIFARPGNRSAKRRSQELLLT